jgi:hypothetical protein
MSKNLFDIRDIHYMVICETCGITYELPSYLANNTEKMTSEIADYLHKNNPKVYQKITDVMIKKSRLYQEPKEETIYWDNE